MIAREVRVLLRKEWRQLTASRGVVISSIFLPVLLLLVVPGLMFFAGSAPGGSQPDEPLPDIGLLGEIGGDLQRLPIALLPIMVAMVGLVMPQMLTSHALIGERETRTLELLVALPVRVSQILQAKLLAVLIFTGISTVPILAVPMTVAMVRGLASPLELLAIPVLLVCVLAFSTTAALLVALLSKDFRTANNLTGIVIAPMLLITMAGGALLPGHGVRPLVLGAIYLLAAFVLARVVTRTVTFERLLR